MVYNMGTEDHPIAELMAIVRNDVLTSALDDDAFIIVIKMSSIVICR